jgi:hypothetical protein
MGDGGLPWNSLSRAYVVLTFLGRAQGRGRWHGTVCNVELKGKKPSRPSKASKKQ